MRRLMLAVLLAFALPFVTKPAAAGVPKNVELMIRRAAVLDNGAHFEAVVKIATQALPDKALDIKALALKLRPDLVAAHEDAMKDDNPVSIAAPEKTGGVVAVKSDGEPGLFSLKGWNTTIELGAALNTGNTNSQTISTSLDFKRQYLSGPTDCMFRWIMPA